MTYADMVMVYAGEGRDAKFAGSLTRLRRLKIAASKRRVVAMAVRDGGVVARRLRPVASPFTKVIFWAHVSETSIVTLTVPRPFLWRPARTA